MSEKLWFLDTLVIPRVPSNLSSDGISILESCARRGDSPPLHVHSEDEVFHVLEGEMTLVVGDERLTAVSGQTVLGPKGIPHTYRVDSDVARWMTITVKGDFERFVRSFSRPAESESLPPPSGPPDEALVTALTVACRAHGIELVGPPIH